MTGSEGAARQGKGSRSIVAVSMVAGLMVVAALIFFLSFLFLLIIVVVILVLAGIGAVAFAFLGARKRRAVENDQAPSPADSGESRKP